MQRRRGTSLVEILMGLGIVAAALVPIAWYFVSSARQQANINSEAVAAGVATRVMNELLDEVPYDELEGASGALEEPIDGTMVEWDVEVVDVGDVQFAWEGESGADSEVLSVLDAKFQDTGWIKDIKLTVRWNTPRDPAMDDPRRTQVLISRRCRL